MNEIGAVLALISSGVLLMAGIWTFVRTLPPLRRGEEDAPELVMILAGMFMMTAGVALIFAVIDR